MSTSHHKETHYSWREFNCYSRLSIRHASLWLAARDSLSETVLESTHGRHNLIDTFEGSSDTPPKMARSTSGPTSLTRCEVLRYWTLSLFTGLVNLFDPLPN